MDVAIIITVSTVLIVFALTVVTRWLVPKALSEEGHDEDHHEAKPQA